MVVDVVVCLTMLAVLAIAITVRPEVGSVPPDALAYGLGGVIALLTLGRRRWPLVVLYVSAAVLLAYYSLGYPAVQPGLALAAPLYTAAAHRRARWAVSVVVSFLVIGLLARYFVEHESFLPMLLNTLEGTWLMVAVVLAGTTVRAHRERVAAAARELAAAEASRAQDAARQVTEERLRIARELHDVLAHTISTVTVQAGVAADVLDDSPESARAALKEIRSASRSAMAELGATLGVLRESLTPVPTLDQLPALVALVERSGLSVSLTSAGSVGPVPAAVGLTAYRIVQESLTNVVRHARCSSASVVLTYFADRLEVSVTDSGSPAVVEGSGGHGIVGMRERALALGGSLSAEPLPGGGFGVRAVLPLR